MNASDTSHEAEAQINDQTPDNDKPSSDQGQSYSDRPSSDWQPEFMRSSGNGPLYRPHDGRMVFGVCAGIAQYLNVDVNVIRIVFAVLTVIGGAGIPVYIAGWLLLPEEGAEQSIASEFIGSLQGRSR
ncbi:MAG TPA: PspC domain-containing protein [Streptosporangiaceae bacterium]|jgi:phage shock protein PspC (stress-responsive transcriptional regulator)